MTDFYKTFYQFILGNDTDIQSVIVSDSKGSAADRMAIYKNAYIYRLIDVLFDDFPTLQQILGDKIFFNMAENYLKKYPSSSYTVRDLGLNLATFLTETRPYSNHPYLTEVAEFEWQKGKTFDGLDASIFSQTDFNQLDLAQLPLARFVFQPTVKRLLFTYDVPQIYQAIQMDSLDKEPSKLIHPMAWVMWRKDLNPHWMSLDVDADWALQQAMLGNDFNSICEGLRQWIDEEHIPNRAASFVRTWLDEKMLHSIQR